MSTAALAIPRPGYLLAGVLAVLAAVSWAAAAHAQSQPAASPTMVTNASTVYSVPATSQPAYLKAFTDPTFNTTLKRIASDPGTSTSPVSGTWGSDTRHHYSKDQPWSSDGAFYSLENRGGSPTQLILDGHTFAPLFGVPSSAGLYDYRWHPATAHPREMINVNSSGTELSWVDVTTGQKTRTWTLPFAVAGFGQGEGNASIDGRYVVLGSSSKMFVVDMDPQPPLAPYPNKRIGPAVDISSCGLSSCTIDWVSSSASGKYAVVNYDGDHPRVFEVNASTLALTPHAEASGSPRCSGTAAAGFVYDVGHADMALNPFDNNADVMIGQEHCGNHGATIGGKAIGYVMMVRLSDGAITPLTSPSNEAYPHHVSTRNIRQPGWAYVSHYEQSGTRFSDEIMAVKMDGSLACMRFAHSHTAFSGCYRCEAHPVPSPDGSMVVFASNWAQDCGSGCGSSSVIKDYVIMTGSSGGNTAADSPRPAAAALALARIWPNPASLPLHVTFALPQDGPAKLELVDVAGRSVLAQELGAPGSGLFDAAFGAGASIRPGTYWLKLSQGGGQTASRIVLLQ